MELFSIRIQRTFQLVSTLNASKCSMNIKLTSNKCRRKLDTQRTRNAEKT